jgi:hypothetical protein
MFFIFQFRRISTFFTLKFYKFILSYSVRQGGFPDSQEHLTKLNNTTLSCYGPPIVVMKFIFLYLIM